MAELARRAKRVAHVGDWYLIESVGVKADDLVFIWRCAQQLWVMDNEKTLEGTSDNAIAYHDESNST